MITCSKNSLTFEFKAVASGLEACAARYVAEWLPRITAPDPASLVEAVLQKNRWVPDEAKAKARTDGASITRERVAEKFREMVSATVRSHESGVALTFQRTLRLPDDAKVYPLPPGLGAFPLRPIDPYRAHAPAEWNRRGGLLMPMYQAEALWLEFNAGYPCALKVGTGLVNAANGLPWSDGLCREPQGYGVLPEQPWLDGYCAGPGLIRQFVAARVGRGYTAEEQLQGSEHGGIQIEAIALKPERYFEKELREELPRTTEQIVSALMQPAYGFLERSFCLCESAAPGMGLGAGGTMKQEIYKDPWSADDWDLAAPLRVWVHLCDALRWHQLTGELPPQKPVTAKDYSVAGLPWFDYYRDDMAAIDGSPVLANLKSVFEAAKENDDDSMPDEDSVAIGFVKPVGPHAPANTVSGWDGN